MYVCIKYDLKQTLKIQALQTLAAIVDFLTEDENCASY